MAAITMAILGMVFIAASASQPRVAETAPREASAPQPALETWYVPAQHVNQATRIEEHIEAF